MKRLNEKPGPEATGLDVGAQKGPRSFGCDRGRYAVDAERGNQSEHPVRHFHALVNRSAWRS